MNKHGHYFIVWAKCFGAFNGWHIPNEASELETLEDTVLKLKQLLFIIKIEKENDF